jgi:hypothetical protein
MVSGRVVVVVLFVLSIVGSPLTGSCLLSFLLLFK